MLVVNSDCLTRAWIEAIVSASGLRVMSYESAGEVLADFRGETPSCAILDLALSDASGFDVQSKLSQGGTSVLCVTREHCISSCVKAVNAGAVDFLTMPCDALELLRALRDAVREAVAVWA